MATKSDFCTDKSFSGYPWKLRIRLVTSNRFVSDQVANISALAVLRLRETDKRKLDKLTSAVGKVRG